MTATDFTQHLQADLWFDSPKDLIDYRLPVVQYYIHHHTNLAAVLSPGRIIYSALVNIVYREQDFCLVNQAYEYIKNEFNEGRLR